MQKLKDILQKLLKPGWSPPATIRDVAVSSLTDIINNYTDWYVENGLYLPPDYATDPSSWNEVLRKIQRAFNLLNDEAHQKGELFEAKEEWKKYGEQDTAKIDDLNKEIKQGLEFFGKYLFDLID